MSQMWIARLVMVALVACLVVPLGGADECEAGLDTDEDGVVDDEDNCVDTPNGSQLDSDGDGVGDACDDTDDTGWDAPAGGVIDLETLDGITLEGDYYPGSRQDSPAVVLLHSIPPNFDRTGWPPQFIDLLTAQDWTVFNVDRRGAGGSEGNAADAYQGELGRNDVEAAVRRYRADGYTGQVAVAGSSNGTTSAIDYAIWQQAQADLGLDVLIFMSGGPYTENQNSLGAVPDVPALFMAAQAEADWSNTAAGARNDWDFILSGGSETAHGHDILQDPNNAAQVDAWLGEYLVVSE
jgi:pimeloyl-ACP methyl ester carboxylesterase